MFKKTKEVKREVHLLTEEEVLKKMEEDDK